MPTPPAIDGKHFRNVLGHFPTGVTIVTAQVDGQPLGFTIGSFTSVSLDPPLVGFLPQKASETWQTMAPAGRFCVNVLRDHQGELCWQFARTGIDDGRFDGLDWTESPSGSPILPEVGAWIDCVTDNIVETGDHYFVLGRVVALDHYAQAHVPLVFFKGTLGGFAAQA